MYLMWLIIPLNQLFATLITKVRLPVLTTGKWSKISPFYLKKAIILLDRERLFFGFIVRA